MTKETLIWAVFVSILCPLFLRSPGDPILLTALQIGGCLVSVAWVDRIERSRRPDTASPADHAEAIERAMSSMLSRHQQQRAGCDYRLL